MDRERTHRRAAVFVLLLALCTAGCRSTEIAPLDSAGERPKDEQALWRAGEAYDRAIAESELYFSDAALERYLNSVARRVANGMQLAPELPLRVRAVRNPLMNASALPHGMIHVHTGLLARIENEAQLATVLGHETAHYVRRHALREQRLARNQMSRQTALLTILSATGALLPAVTLARIADLDAGDLMRRQLSGYSRELESEADALGLAAMRSAGYDPQASVRVFALLDLDEEDARIADPYLYSSHPMLAERIASYQALLAVAPSGERPGELGADDYSAAIGALLIQNARDDLALARVKSARIAITRRLALAPLDAEANYLLGEWERTAGPRGSLERAAAAYAEAVRIDPAHADAWRQLGLAQRQRGERAIAAASLMRAIELAPEAGDRAILETYVRELSSTTVEP